MHQFGWLSERGGNFLNLLQKEGITQKGGGLPTLEETVSKIFCIANFIFQGHLVLCLNILSLHVHVFVMTIITNDSPPVFLQLPSGGYLLKPASISSFVVESNPLVGACWLVTFFNMHVIFAKTRQLKLVSAIFYFFTK